MHVEFTETELQYIVKKPFSWYVKDDAPSDVMESAKRKIGLIRKQSIGPKSLSSRRQNA